MPREKEYVDLEEVIIERETARAVLLSVGDGQVWVPKSLLGPDTEIAAEGEIGRVSVERWFCEKEGIEP